MASARKSQHGQRVVIAMDGSEYSDYALKWYVEYLHKSPNRVILVYCPEYRSLVHNPFMTIDASKVTEIVRKEENRIKLFLAKLKEDIHRYKINGKAVRAAGIPGEAVLQIARGEGADYIVTGSRGQSKLRRTFLGSVSDYIVHHSVVPVIVATKRINEQE